MAKIDWFNVGTLAAAGCIVIFGAAGWQRGGANDAARMAQWQFEDAAFDASHYIVNKKYKSGVYHWTGNAQYHLQCEQARMIFGYEM